MGSVYSRCLPKRSLEEYILEDFDDIEEYEEPPEEKMSESFVSSTIHANHIINDAESALNTAR